MENLLTPDEAAALLTERGVTARDGGPVKPDTLRYWLERGRFPNARHIPGPGKGIWLIPVEDIDALRVVAGLMMR